MVIVLWPVALAYTPIMVPITLISQQEDTPSLSSLTHLINISLASDKVAAVWRVGQE